MLKNSVLQQLWIDAATYPYRSLIALEYNILDLHLNFVKPQAETPFKIFKDKFEQTALERYAQHHISLEDIRSIMDYAWFGDSYYKTSNSNITSFPIETLIKNFSHSILYHNGHHLTAYPNIDNSFFKNSNSVIFDGTISSWQYLVQFVNPDLIVAAYYAFDTKIQNLPVDINESCISLPDVNQFNDFKFTEQHLHQGACPSFSQVWNLYLDSLRYPDLKIEQYECNNKNIKPILLIAWFLKLCLFEYIEYYNYMGKHIPEDFRINNKVMADLQNIIKYVNIDSVAYDTKEHTVSPWDDNSWKKLEEEIINKCSKRSEILKNIYRDNHKEFKGYIIDALSATNHYHSRVHDITSDDMELPFLCDCLKLVQKKTEFSILFRQFLWIYIRCQQIVYGLVVQREGCHGLNHFQHYYRQGGRFIAPTIKSQLSLNFYLKNISLHGKVKKIELRLGNSSSKISFSKLFSERTSEYQKLLRQNQYIPYIGLTIHFVKSWGRDYIEYSMPNEDEHKYRYWNLLSSWWEEMSELCKAIENKPTLSFIFRGIDVASRELTVPSWPVALIYREFKNRMQKIANSSLHDSNDFAMPHLTAHAGEDFNTPVTGLRKIYEAIRFYGMLPGDRIGHAIALGYDVEALANRTTSILIPVRDYLADLCWQIIFMREDCGDEMNTIRPNIELELNDLLAYMRQASIPQNIANLLTRQNVLDCYIMQFPHSEALNEHNFKLFHKFRMVEFYNSEVKLPQVIEKIDINDLSDCERLLYYYLFSKELWAWEQALGLVEISLSPRYVEQVKLFQHQMHKYVSSKEITVELCPTSNRIISSMKSYDEHPLFKLCPIEKTSERLSVSINSDDPMIFNTNIQNEYSQIFDAGKSKGYSSYEVMQWLREINVNSDKTSFCYPESSHFEAIYPNDVNSPSYYKDKREFIIKKLEKCID